MNALSRAYPGSHHRPTQWPQLGRVIACSLTAVGLTACAETQQVSGAHGQFTLHVADAARDGGQTELALLLANVVLQRYPNDVPALVARGDAYYAMGQVNLASDAYRKAVSIDPNSAGAQLGLGRTLIRFDPRGAGAAFEVAASRDPGNPAALNDLGITRDMLGDHAAAQAAYRKALAIAPDMADVKVNLGMSLALAGEKQQSVEMLQGMLNDPRATNLWRHDTAAAMTLAGDPVGAKDVIDHPRAATTLNTSASFDAPSPAVVKAMPERAAPETASTPVFEEQLPELPASKAPIAVQSTADEVLKPIAPATPDYVELKPFALAPPSVAYDIPDDAIAPMRPAAAPAQAAPDYVALTPFVLAPPSVVYDIPDDTLAPTRPVAATPAMVSTRLVTASAASSAAGVEAIAPTAADVAPLGGHAVQLGAEESEQEANVQWAALQRQIPSLLDGRPVAISQAVVNNHMFWRVRATDFASLESAMSFCIRLKGAGADCWAL